jgi:CRISPR/Cas system-associated exonuclease Cas4 (RecB family)
MRKINASEINTFLFCERAWWYQHQGIESNNVKELASGSDLHHQHSRDVVASGFLRIIAYVVLLVAIIMFSIYLILQIL